MKENDIKISIVIPIHNCDKYLKKCLDSILSQDYMFLEVILVDDESTDDSGRIIDEYSVIDSRVSAIHIKKSGVAKARNIGIEHSTGKYICFFDSDDYLESDYISFALNKMETENADLFNSGFYSEIHGENVTRDAIFVPEKIYFSKEEFKKDLVFLWDKHMLYNVWNKMYSLKIIKDNRLCFPNMNFGEDVKFNMAYLEFVDRFYNSDRCFYHYIKERKGSLTSKYKDNLFEIRKKEYSEFNEYFESHGVKNYEEFNARRFIERILGCIENACSSDLDVKEKKKVIKIILNDEITRKTLKLAKPTSRKVKIMLIPLKLKSLFMTYYMGVLVGMVRRKAPGLFNKMKNER